MMTAKIKVYEMSDDTTWVAAKSELEAIKEWCSEFQEMPDGVKAKEVSAEAMERLIFFYDVPFADPTPHTTFAKRLAELIEQGESFPCIFACTEY
jgi:hypothetical protein